MDLEASSRHGVLERMLLDENAEPADLPLALLKEITNSFSPDHEIGSGGFAVVYKGMVGKRMVAVKKLFKTFDIVYENKFHKEVECLMKAKHKNVVRFLGYCVDTQGKVEDYEGKFVMADLRNWLLCFEYVPNGSLEKYIADASGGLEWKERLRIIKGICEGLHYLHRNRILHLDLKPANILLDGHMVPKITDFGLSRCLDEDKTHATTKHLSGTPGYLAPEFYTGKITFASDIYSLGVIIMEILTGVKGYPEDENVIESWMNRLEGEAQLEQVRVCTKIGIECMESNPKKRPVARRIIDMLDKTASADESGMGSSLVEPQVSLLKEKSDRERIGMLAESLRQENIKEHPETEDAAERLGNDHSQQDEENTDHSSFWEAQVTELTSFFSWIFSVLDKLNIFRRWDFMSDVCPHCHIRNFTEEEIKKITRNYSEIIGRGSFARVYKGTLPDNTMVAVKTYIMDMQHDTGEFVHGVAHQAQMIHKNIIMLVGYCLEADLPILVYEYAVNGSLRDILHGNENQMLPLDLRLDIAIGSAEGLKYMHSRGIQHGNVKQVNILLDEKLTPKISDPDSSRLHNVDVSVAETIFGSPVFNETGLLKPKSDVCSFGAVLLELITRKQNVYNYDCSLIVEYRKCYEIEKSGRAMFDEKIAAEEDIFVLEEIGKLAIECLKEDMEERPDMTEVTERLMMLSRDRGLGKARNTS